MIDVQALAVPAFLAAFPPQGGPAEMALNAAACRHADLLRVLKTEPADPARGAEAGLAAGLRDCAVSRASVDILLTRSEHGGETGWRASLVPLAGRTGRVAGVLGICREAALREPETVSSDGHLSLALRAIHGAEWRYDVGEGVYAGSDEIATLLGEGAPRPVAWAEWLERVHPQDLGPFLAAPAPDGEVEFRFHASGGELRWARCSRVAVTGEDGRVEAVLGIMVDITPERVRETAWAELASHDPLTGLLNRRGLRGEVDRLQAGPAGTSSLALFAIDLDHFKTTNDSHGHAAGDAVLVEASRRLATAIDSMVCARLGGDEFVAVLPVWDEAQAHRVRDRLCQAFRRPLAFRGRWLPVSASVGVACASGAVDIVRLMDAADADLYARKDARGCARAAAA